jgi:hypothetical protein
MGYGNPKGEDVKCFLVAVALCVVALILAPCSEVCAESIPVSDAPRWPRVVKGWKWDGEQGIYDRKSLYDYIDGAAEVYLAYHFERVEARRYVREGRPSLVAELYRMAHSEDAFGLFMLERQDPEADIGQGSEFGGGMLRFWKGRYFASLFAEGESGDAEQALLALGRSLAASITETGQPPDLLRYLSGVLSGRDPARLCFVRSHILLNRCFFISHENILGLGLDVEALLVRLPGEKDAVRVLLLRYPSEPRAASTLRRFADAYMPDAREGAVVKTEDGRWTSAVQYRQFATIVFGAPAQAEAASLTSAIVEKIKEGTR